MPITFPPHNGREKIDMEEPTRGVLMISDERTRQIRVEGYTAEHDAQHDSGELAQAAVCYLVGDNMPFPFPMRGLWPWEARSFKPTGDAIRDLTKAGALIAAEIDRLTTLLRA